MGTKREFTIQRGGRLERTIVGKTGQEHHPDPDGHFTRILGAWAGFLDPPKHGKDGHFTDEGQYRRAIERAVAENTQ